MSTFYAVFQDPRKARLAAMALVNQGVPSDDISLVSRGAANAFGSPPTAEQTAQQSMADATNFVGRGDDPKVDEILGREAEVGSRGVFESAVGAGISTSSANDSIASVDESDDSQWLSEPGEGETEEASELRDMNRTLNTGFPTAPASLGTDSGFATLPIDDLDISLEAIDVPGFGVVMGGGALATAALDYGDGNPSDDVEEMMKYFRGEGVPEETASAYLRALDGGEALLAVGLVPGEVEAPLLDAVGEQFGASQAATYDAPRY